ncbi:uncharacterized protein LOC133866637 [Alnus glutinosa]|uniref:uncharacterized protein LOC133866637 n=1 Tax=Alnus glutinosa TaxID=3517 RepID=UPI002D774634|nr:uncharacterized protein LOC133866637 [Alnus glutinosa]
MFDSMFELITQAASNHLFIFCFCNLIIAFVLVGSKPTPKIGRAGEIPLSLVINTRTNRNPGTDSKLISYDDKETLRDVNQVSCSQEAPPVDDREENGNRNFQEEGEDHDDDELRRRVEEFIEKVNRGWKAEILRS